MHEEERIAQHLSEDREQHFSFSLVADDGRIFAKSLLVALNSWIPQVDNRLSFALLFPSPESTVSKSFRAVWYPGHAQEKRQIHECFICPGSQDAGMLICSGSTVVAIDVDEALRDIIIHSRTWLEAEPDATAIDTGIVARSFFEEKYNAYCHGVAFRYESPNVREAQWQLATAGE